MTCHKRSNNQHFNTECVSTTQTYHDTYKLDRFHVSIAGVPFDSCQELHSHLTQAIAHHLYAFSTSREGQADSNGTLRKPIFQRSGRVFPVMSTFWVLELSCGRSESGPENECWHISIEIQGFDPLPCSKEFYGDLYSKFALRIG